MRGKSHHHIQRTPRQNLPAIPHIAARSRQRACLVVRLAQSPSSVTSMPERLLSLSYFGHSSACSRYRACLAACPPHLPRHAEDIPVNAPIETPINSYQHKSLNTNPYQCTGASGGGVRPAGRRPAGHVHGVGVPLLPRCAAAAGRRGGRPGALAGQGPAAAAVPGQGECPYFLFTWGISDQARHTGLPALRSGLQVTVCRISTHCTVNTRLPVRSL